MSYVKCMLEATTRMVTHIRDGIKMVIFLWYLVIVDPCSYMIALSSENSSWVCLWTNTISIVSVVDTWAKNFYF